MKIIAVARNYIDHAAELHNPVPERPVIFMKPDTALLRDDRDFYCPEFSRDIHYECEIIVRICNEGRHIAEKFAHRYYDAIGLGIDFTARDVQAELKSKGLPWELAKAFDHSAVAGPMVPKGEFADVRQIPFSLRKNGTVVQSGNTKDMVFGIDTLLAFISRHITLRKGDLLYTGTPAGVGPVAIGDLLEGFIADRRMFRTHIK